MSLSDLNRKHLSLIGIFSTRYAIRGGAGLVFLLLVLFVGLMVAHIVLMPLEQMKIEMKKAGRSEAETQEVFDALISKAKPYVSWAIGDRENPIEVEDDGRIQDRWAAYLLEEKPAMLSAVLLVLLFIVPFMSVLGGFNQYSGDVGTRGIRYQLLRTERANIYFGRYIGTVFYSALTMALLIATIVAYMGFKLEYYSWGALLGWGARGWFALVMLVIPYAALCGWVSSLVDSPFASLVLCILCVVGVPLAAVIAGLQWPEAKYIKWLLPWGIQNDLLHYSALKVLLAIAACFGYTAVFMTIGYRHFSKRDL